ncbi:hypothetical protein Glove_283g84 [Diversispora epigaea]|uniref:WSC domain-containing protein n=1 Tax=Diversispora epigaea TaxID=1348612 RepID=A0A397I3M3_9GLOM|nr:hypothetical protein Glove_283g84 [Diversispora epigaea]
MLRPPGLSFYNPYKDEYTDEDLYPALMDPTSCTIHCVYETGVDIIDKCIKYCIFGYAGLETGSQCFCGNNFISKDINLSLENCSFSCVDTKSEGDNSTSLSRTKIIGITVGVVKRRSETNDTDDTNDRISTPSLITKTD